MRRFIHICIIKFAQLATYILKKIFEVKTSTLKGINVVMSKGLEESK